MVMPILPPLDVTVSADFDFLGALISLEPLVSLSSTAVPANVSVVTIPISVTSLSVDISGASVAFPEAGCPAPSILDEVTSRFTASLEIPAQSALLFPNVRFSDKPIDKTPINLSRFTAHIQNVFVSRTFVEYRAIGTVPDYRSSLPVPSSDMNVTVAVSQRFARIIPIRLPTETGHLDAVSLDLQLGSLPIQSRIYESLHRPSVPGPAISFELKVRVLSVFIPTTILGWFVATGFPSPSGFVDFQLDGLSLEIDSGTPTIPVSSRSIEIPPKWPDLMVIVPSQTIRTIRGTIVQPAESFEMIGFKIQPFSIAPPQRFRTAPVPVLVPDYLESVDSSPISFDLSVYVASYFISRLERMSIPIELDSHMILFDDAQFPQLKWFHQRDIFTSHIPVSISDRPEYIFDLDEGMEIRAFANVGVCTIPFDLFDVTWLDLRMILPLRTLRFQSIREHIFFTESCPSISYVSFDLQTIGFASTISRFSASKSPIGFDSTLLPVLDIYCPSLSMVHSIRWFSSPLSIPGRIEQLDVLGFVPTIRFQLSDDDICHFYVLNISSQLGSVNLSWLDLQLILQLPIATVAQIAGRNSLPDLICSLDCPVLVFDWLLTLMPVFGRHDAYLPSLLMSGAVLQHWESFSIAELSDLIDIRPICLDSFIPNSPPERLPMLAIYPVRSLAEVRSDQEVAEFVSDFSEMALCSREVHPQISHHIWLSLSFARPL
jgi:hypothetical protein